MLDLFRRRKGGLKWILWLVILVLGAGMLLFFVQTPGGIGVGLGNQNVAIVAGNAITVNQYRRLYNQIYDSYRQRYPVGFRECRNPENVGSGRPGTGSVGQRIRDRLWSSEHGD